MKRTPFKQPTYEEKLLKAKNAQIRKQKAKLSTTSSKTTKEAVRGKSKAKKAKKVSISSLKKKLWTVFSEYIRTRDKNICFICGKYATGSAYHAGHFIPKSVGGIALYFNEDNVHGCCYHCNINLGGNLYEYGMKLGKEKCDELYEIKKQTNKWSVEEYESKIQLYKSKLISLSTGK